MRNTKKNKQRMLIKKLVTILVYVLLIWYCPLLFIFVFVYNTMTGNKYL